MNDAHVYSWFLDGDLENASALFRHWAMEFKQILAWNKTYPSGIERLGVGHYFRNNAEYCLFGVRGNIRTRARNIPKSFTAPVVGEHSSKPEKFYEIVRAASYPPLAKSFSANREMACQLVQPRGGMKMAA